MVAMRLFGVFALCLFAGCATELWERGIGGVERDAATEPLRDAGSEHITPLDAGFDGFCQPGGLRGCPSSIAACKSCLLAWNSDPECKMGSLQCGYSRACYLAHEDFLHCLGDGHLLPRLEVQCIARCPECLDQPFCN